MRVIGLTGGIASGKSTVINALRSLGAVVIHADDIAHDLMATDTPAWKDVVKTFGNGVLNPDQTIDRKKLGKIVFDNPEMLKKLNQIAHPRIFEKFKNELARIKSSQPESVVVMEIPLLYETHMDRLCDEVWVIWVDRETQIKRLMSRDSLNREDAIKRIESQMSLDEKAKRADLVLDNTRSIEETIAIASRYFREIIHED